MFKTINFLENLFNRYTCTWHGRVLVKNIRRGKIILETGIICKYLSCHDISINYNEYLIKKVDDCFVLSWSSSFAICQILSFG